jgi:hypothetical protein
MWELCGSLQKVRGLRAGTSRTRRKLASLSEQAGVRRCIVELSPDQMTSKAGSGVEIKLKYDQKDA